MAEQTLRIATRKSLLAVAQAEHVAERLRLAHAGLTVELVRMSTEGDRLLDSSLAKVGGKGLFVKELEEGMLRGEADIAVHSMKDVPVSLPDELHLPVILERHDPRDAFISGRYADLDELPPGSRVGTSSLRRRCHLAARYPHLEIVELRGNIHTRLRKLDEGQCDAIILATAGLKRVGLEGRITRILDPEQSLPAIGQGALGIECRRDDDRVETLVGVLDHPESAERVRAERAVNARLHGGCQVPIAAYAIPEADRLHLQAMVGHPDGSPVYRSEATAPRGQPEDLGRGVAEDLLAQGAGAVLRELGMFPSDPYRAETP